MTADEAAGLYAIGGEAPQDEATGGSGSAGRGAAPRDGAPHQRALWYHNVTIIKPQGHVLPAHIDPVADMFQEIAGPDGLWFIGLELGPVAGHLHFQAMTGSDSSSPASVTRRLKTLVEPYGYQASSLQLSAARTAIW